MKLSLSYYLYLVSTRIDKYVYCIYTYILYIYTTYLYIGKDNSVSIFQPILQLLHSISTPTMLIDSSTQTQSWTHQAALHAHQWSSSYSTEKAPIYQYRYTIRYKYIIYRQTWYIEIIQLQLITNVYNKNHRIRSNSNIIRSNSYNQTCIYTKNNTLDTLITHLILCSRSIYYWYLHSFKHCYICYFSIITSTSIGGGR